MKQTIWLLIPVLIAVYSCTEADFNSSDFVVGDVFIDSNIRVLLIDTMQVETSTMKFDSIITSQSSRILVGKYTDPIFGEVTCSSYLGLIPEHYSIDPEAEYDSIALLLKYDDYYYNDTLQSNTMVIKQLKEVLKPDEGDDFYNTTEVGLEEQILGSLSYIPRPSDTTALEVKLTDELGKDLFVQLQNKSMTNADEFQAYFKGLGIQPGISDDGSIIGFSLAAEACYMRLYHSIAEADGKVQKTLDFPFNAAQSPKPFFNQIKAQDASELLTPLIDQEINLNSSDASNMSFIQSGTGVATRIRFPSIKSLYDIKGNGTLLDVVLKIRPVTGTYDERLYLRDTLSVFLVDQNNELTNQLYRSEIEPVRAILNRANEEFDDIFYEIPLGGYIETLLLTEADTKEALVLLPADYNNAVDRFVLNGNDNTHQYVSLQITYTIYDENE